MNTKSSATQDLCSQKSILIRHCKGVTTAQFVLRLQEITASLQVYKKLFQTLTDAIIVVACLPDSTSFGT